MPSLCEDAGYRHGQSISTRCTGAFASPLQEWPEDLSLRTAAVEFALVWKNAHQVESGGIQIMITLSFHFER
jgi:hypothetical protein